MVFEVIFSISMVIQMNIIPYESSIRVIHTDFSLLDQLKKKKKQNRTCSLCINVLSIAYLKATVSTKELSDANFLGYTSEINQNP